MITNCLSIDVECFIESNLQSFSISKNNISNSKAKYELEKNMDFILSFLNTHHVKGTFFFLGRIAKDNPKLVKETAQHGHEIACHGYNHLRIYSLTKNEFKESIEYAKKSLEDVSGNIVYGFRAPDFSITKSSLWALDILRENGFLYDSSIYPIAHHDVYGIKNTKPFIHNLPNGLIEFPPPTIKLFGLLHPFGGGGYFRLYPLFITKFFIQKLNKLGHPYMFYIHPYELGPIAPKISEMSLYRKFRHLYNCKNVVNKLKKILKFSNFYPAIDILKNNNLLQ